MHVCEQAQNKIELIINRSINFAVNESTFQSEHTSIDRRFFRADDNSRRQTNILDETNVRRHGHRDTEEENFV